VLAFDMRSPPRLYMRLPDDAGPAPQVAAATGGSL
jgi:cell division protein FtsQ